MPMGASQVRVRGSQVEVEGQIMEDEDDEDKSPSVGTDSDSASRTDHFWLRGRRASATQPLLSESLT